MAAKRKRAKAIRRTTGKGGNYRKTKSGAGMTKKGVKEEDGSVNMSLYENINKRKKAGTSRSKKNSTISKKSYANMKKGFPKYQSGGLVKAEIARGCGAVMGDRRKVTKHY